MTQKGVRAFLVFFFTLAAAVCLVLGITMPVVDFTRLYFWTDTHSLTSIITALYQTGEVFLAGVIFIFSIVVPSFKLLYIAAAGTLMTQNVELRSRWLKRIEWLGKWSMLDVLIMALLVFYAKSTRFADAAALPGIYFFAASVALTIAAYSFVDRDISEDKADKRLDP